MVIQHNISALNSHRNMGLNNAGTAKNLEKLSSGFKINRAGDDAAGLAISEKMRGQIRGLAMAEQNVSNGVSLIQTAEGGLNETHAILQRMRELAVQASNGTYQEEDLKQLTEEYNALKSEITRIADSTHYNGIKLLDGSLGNGTSDTLKTESVKGLITSDINRAPGSTLPSGTDVEIVVGTITPGSDVIHDAITVGITADGDEADGDVFSFEFNSTSFTTQGVVGTGAAGAVTADDIALAMFKAITADADYRDGSLGFTVTLNGSDLTFTSTSDTDTGFDALTIDNLVNDTQSGEDPIAAAGTAVTYVAAQEPTMDPGTTTINGNVVVDVAYDKTTNKFTLMDGEGNTVDIDASKAVTGATATVTMGKAGDDLVFQIGANGGQDQRVSLSVDNMNAKNIGYKAGDVLSDGKIATGNKSVEESSIDNIPNANDAINVITAATNQVSTQRAQLGALQNRLEHTLNNLGVTKENLTAAESSIRDVDMAKEMMDFTKNNILIQASQAMLAQANQLPQGVLQLLR